MRPLQIRAVTGGFVVACDGATAQAYGARKRRGGVPNGVLVMDPNSGKLTFDAAPGATPHVFAEKDSAASIAHQIGRYILGFGDLVYAYTDTPTGFWAE